jgi:hypothetical protein
MTTHPVKNMTTHPVKKMSRKKLLPALEKMRAQSSASGELDYEG